MKKFIGIMIFLTCSSMVYADLVASFNFGGTLTTPVYTSGTTGHAGLNGRIINVIDSTFTYAGATDTANFIAQGGYDASTNNAGFLAEGYQSATGTVRFDMDTDNDTSASDSYSTVLSYVNIAGGAIANASTITNLSWGGDFRTDSTGYFTIKNGGSWYISTEQASGGNLSSFTLTDVASELWTAWTPATVGSSDMVTATSGGSVTSLSLDNIEAIGAFATSQRIGSVATARGRVSSLEVYTIPEPSALGLLVFGGFIMARVRRARLSFSL